MKNIKQLLPWGVKVKIKSWKHKGSRFYCNICNSHVKNFYPSGVHSQVFEKLDIVGGGHFEYDTCPVCLSGRRQRLAWMFLNKYWFSDIKKTDRIRILHMAPEEPLYRLMQRMNNMEIYYGDTDPERYWFCSDIQFVDLTDIPFESGFFDWVIATHILEHIPDDYLAMKEIYRVLKNGGCALLQTPIAQNLEMTYEDPKIILEEDRIKHYGQKDHVRVYGKDYAKKLEMAGFEVQIKDPSEIMKDEIALSTCIDKREKIYTAHKTKSLIS